MITNEEAEQFDRDLEKLRRQRMKRIPNVIFKMRHNDHVQLGGACAIGGVWKDVTTSQLFDNRKILFKKGLDRKLKMTEKQVIKIREKVYMHCKNHNLDVEKLFFS